MNKKNAYLFFSFFLFLSCQNELKDNKPVITELQNETLKMYEQGKLIFLEKCAQCHNNNMITDGTGSPLGGITKRSTKEWLRAYVRSPEKMIEKNDSQALVLLEKKRVIMQGFPDYTDAELDQIFLYIETTYQNNKIRLHPVER